MNPRKNDKKILIIQICIGIIITLIGAYDRLDQKSTDKQFELMHNAIKEVKEANNKSIESINENKDAINKVRLDYMKDLSKTKDEIKEEIKELIAWIKENGKIL